MVTEFDGYSHIKNACLNAFDGEETIVPVTLGLAIMKHEEFPMHYPFHHYLVPAVMLTATYKACGKNRQAMVMALEESLSRALNVLKGFCGFYGDCGAAVGLGIFMSILTETTPYSESTWSITNMITAKSLMKMAEIGGPRCCKRNSFIAFLEGSLYIRETLDIHLKTPEKITCTFSHLNDECKKDECPFYEEVI